MAKKKTKTKAAAKKTSRAKTSPKRASKKESRAEQVARREKMGVPKGRHETIGNCLKLTQEIIDGLTEIVAQGNFRYVARGKMGIPHGTFNSWLQRGRQHILDYEKDGKWKDLSMQAKLVQALDKAENDNHAKIISNVMGLDPTNPMAVKLQLDYLYRRHGQLYRKGRTAIDDETGETIKIVDPFEALAEKLAPYIDD